MDRLRVQGCAFANFIADYAASSVVSALPGEIYRLCICLLWQFVLNTCCDRETGDDDDPHYWYAALSNPERVDRALRKSLRSRQLRHSSALLLLLE